MNNLRTYQTRMSEAFGDDSLLSSYAALFGRAERSLFAKLQASAPLTTLKREFIRDFGITARQFNAISSKLAGSISSAKEQMKIRIETLEARVASTKRAVKQSKTPFIRHQKSRRLVILQERLKRLKEDRASGKVRLCFGSRKLFRAQFNLTGNGYESHEQWKEEWGKERSNQFFVIGSKDETAGCQGCVASVAEDGSISLSLRLPNALADKAKHVVIMGLRFGYGHQEIITAIGRNLSKDKTDWQAISYRFLRDAKGWRVFVTVDIPEVEVISRKDTGVIGVDINADHLAATETDRFGNPVKFFSIPCITYGKTAEQRQAVIGDLVKQVIAFTAEKRKPIVIEQLDFRKKKAAMRKDCPRYARMLLSLAYAQIQTILRARAFDAGIEVLEVNPAYTSVIGQYKFSGRYGMSRHQAAALAIGRRSSGLGEKLPRQLHVTLPLSVRNRGRHVWSKWAAVSRRDQAAHVARRRSRTSSGSSSAPTSSTGDTARRVIIIPPDAGEIPACESSLELFE
jgi:IS605 OrfB family transposase